MRGITGRPGRGLLRGLCGASLVLASAGAAVAQAGNPDGSTSNSGALQFSATLDAPSVYVFRGLVQEREPTITLTPSADVSAAFGSVRVHLGTWHALLGGSSGENGPTGRLHYEERFSAGATMPLAGMAVDATYTSYSGPGLFLAPRHEVAIRLETRRWYGSYALAAVELDGAADGLEDGKGTYLELGATPDLPLGAGRARLGVPIRVGLSLNNYYQAFRDDSRFGFFNVGGRVTLPLGQRGPRGSWDLHGGVEFYLLGDAPKATNGGQSEKVVATAGLSLRY